MSFNCGNCGAILQNQQPFCAQCGCPINWGVSSSSPLDNTAEQVLNAQNNEQQKAKKKAVIPRKLDNAVGGAATFVTGVATNVANSLNNPDDKPKEKVIKKEKPAKKEPKKLYIDQRYEWTIRDTYEITDENGADVYLVKGSFMKIPKRFTILNIYNQPVAEVVEKFVAALPTYFLHIGGVEVAKIRKDFTLLKPEFRISGPGLKVKGNVLGSNFEILKDGKAIGKFNKNILGRGDYYVMEVLDGQYELLVVGMILTIDHINKKKGHEGNRRRL